MNEQTNERTDGRSQRGYPPAAAAHVDGPQVVHVLSAGAAKGLFETLAALLAARGLAATGSFGAVGAMQDKLLAGEACDLLVLTRPMLERLAAEGRVDAGSITPIGTVATGIAVPRGTPLPDVSSRRTLAGNLRAAGEVHFPDPARATAGMHFAKVLAELGLSDELAARCRHHPNGATAMATLAEARAPRTIGCTQVTEILYTPGVVLVAELPPPFRLRTVYAAAVIADSPRSDQARAMLALITGSEGAAARARGGFVDG